MSCASFAHHAALWITAPASVPTDAVALSGVSAVGISAGAVVTDGDAGGACAPPGPSSGCMFNG